MKVRHPIFNQLFEQQPDGLVKVEDLDKGTEGYFERKGKWVHGDLKFADLQLLDWIGGKPLPASPTPDAEGSLEVMGYH